MNRPIFLISLRSMYRAGSKFFTSPAMRQAKAVASNCSMREMPLPALANGLPVLLGANAQGADQSHSGYHNSARKY